MDSKSPVKSRTLWAAIPCSALFFADAVHSFLSSGGLESVCAQKSALAGGLLALTAILRFYTSQPIVAPKEGKDDRGDPSSS